MRMSALVPLPRPRPGTTPGRPAPMRIAALLTAAAGLALPATAAQLQVSVTGSDGRPAADVAVLVQPTSAWPAQPLPEAAVIAQQGTRFVPFVTVVPVGGTVRFVNQDRYDHHVRSQPGGPLGNVPPAKQFEFRMAAAGTAKAAPADLKMDLAGSVVLGCHLHGSMRGHLLVSPTPWFAVTDERGQATIAGVPDGEVELRLWHPDQLTDQAAQRLAASGTQALQGRLNFSPRRRPAPRMNDYYQ